MKRWLLPEGVQDVLRNVRVRPRRPTESPQLALTAEMVAKNADLKDCHKGQRCFILATGPSVKEQDLTVLSGELCIGVAFFFLHPQIDIIQPRYHVFAPNHPPFDFDRVDRDLVGAEKHYKHKPIVFYGYRPYRYSVLNYFEQHPREYSLPFRLLNYSNSMQMDEKNYASKDIWDITAAPFQPRTVVYSAIQVAVFMGCMEIYLIGCDHDYLNNLQRTENHYYPEASGNPNDVSFLLSEFTTERWFYEYYSRWRDYRLMQEYLASRGVRIINSTKGGMLDVFPRMRLEDVARPSVARPSGA